MARRIFLWFLVVFYGMAPTRVQAAVNLQCSAFAGQVAVNEVVIGENKSGFVELKVISSGLDASVVKAWTLFFVSKNQNPEGKTLSSTGATLHIYSPAYQSVPLAGYQGVLPEGSYITIPEALFTNAFTNNPGEILLSTSASADPNPNTVVVDYLFYRVGQGLQKYWNVHSACNEILSLDNANVENVCVYPDSPGNWQSSSCDPTPGAPNDGSGVTPPLDHFRIRHDGHGLTCRPEEVTVQACADADCNDLFSASAVTVTLAPSGWVGGDEQTFTGNGTFRLRRTAPGIAILGIANASLTPQNATRCYENGVLGDCTLEFHETGFLFDLPDLTSCQTGAPASIRAVRRDDDTQACVGDDSFAGSTRQVRFWTEYVQPGSGSLALSVNNVAVAGSAPGTAVTLTFDATATAYLTPRYNDAGALTLHARFDGSGDEAGLVLTGADSFVVIPHHLEVSATTDGAALLNNAASGGNPHWPAGEDFHLRVETVCADGTVTPNFAWQTVLTPTACVPACGTLGNGALAATEFAAGVAAPADIFYGEVGNLKIQAVASNYLGTGINVSGISDVIGRFTPHHFAVTLNTPVFQTACPTGAFTYLGEPFGYETAPVVGITAQNKQNGVTQNYTSAWWKITDSSLSGKIYTVFNGSVETAGLPTVDPLIEDFGGGLGSLTFSAGAGIAVARALLTAPFEAEISLEITLADEDGVAPLTNPIRFGEAVAGGGIDFSDGKGMRWGRLVLENAYGSELLDLALPLRAQYWNGTGFVLHGEDSCTILDGGRLSLSSAAVAAREPGLDPIRVNPAASNTTTAQIPAILAGGVGDLLFSAPGDGGDGWVDVLMHLNGFSFNGVVYGEFRPWLRFDWDGDGVHDNDPRGRATFGIYRNDDRIIYWRESVD